MNKTYPIERYAELNIFAFLILLTSVPVFFLVNANFGIEISKTLSTVLLWVPSIFPLISLVLLVISIKKKFNWAALILVLISIIYFFTIIFILTFIMALRNGYRG